MRRMLAFLMAAVLLVTAAGCGSKTVPMTEPEQPTVTEPTEPAPAEPAVTAPTEAEEDEDASPYSQQTMMLAENPDSYKSIGRTYYTEMKCTGLVCAWPASGLEFTVACEGDIQMTYTALENGYFAVEVDGVMQPDRIRTKTLNNKTVNVVTGLPEGEHTIRIVKDSDINAAGAFTVLTSIEYFGDPATFRATPDNQYYIEFIGDSITAGKGALMSGVYEADDPGHSATASYAYQFAKMLGADYSIVARGGIGVIHRSQTLPLIMQEVYPYVNGFAKDPTEYGFERRPDLVVLALGTNDSGDGSADDFHKAMAEMITEIRTGYGEEVPILLLYNMMTGGFGAEFQPIAEENHCFSCCATRNNDGGHSGTAKGHPSAAGHLVVAQELMEAWSTLRK